MVRLLGHLDYRGRKAGDELRVVFSVQGPGLAWCGAWCRLSPSIAQRETWRSGQSSRATGARCDLQAAPVQAILRSVLRLCHVLRGLSGNTAGTGLARPLLMRRILPRGPPVEPRDQNPPFLRTLRCARPVLPQA